MRNLFWMLLACAAAAVLVKWLSPTAKTDTAPTQASEAAAPQGEVYDRKDSASQITVEASDRLLREHQSPDASESELAAAEAAINAAEARLDALSLQLDGIEAQVADIEARGDDPAEHAEEVMVYMQPVLDEYLDAEAMLEAAIERRDRVKAALNNQRYR